MIQSDQRLNHSVYVAKYNSHDSLVTETDSAIINMTVVPKNLFAKWAEYKLCLAPGGLGDVRRE